MKLNKQNVPFTMVANEVLYRRDISLKAKGIFAYLFSKPESWDFAAERICLECREDRKTILSALKELELVGLLNRRKLPSGRVEYMIEYATQSPKSGLRHSDPKSEKGTVAKGHSGKNGLLSNTEGVSNTEEESNKEESCYGFEEFWNDYPLKVSKKKAQQIYSRIKEVDRAVIKLDLPKRKETDSWKREFIPHPTTYLNGERWTDEYVSPRSGYAPKVHTMA